MMDDTPETRDRKDFSRRLKSLRPVECQSTLSDGNRCKRSQRETELLDSVRFEDCVVALATVELQRQLCLTAIVATKWQRGVIVGEHISEDDDFISALDALIQVDIHVLRSTPCSRRSLDGVYVMKPDLFVTFLNDGIQWTRTAPLMVLWDFQHYLNLRHPYRKVIASIQESRERPVYPVTKILAIVEQLDVSGLDALESDLKRLRTPLKLTCCFGTPKRAYAKDTAIDVRFVYLRRLTPGKFPWLDEREIEAVGATLRGSGLVDARRQAEKIVGGRPAAELQDFIVQCKGLIVEAKAKAVLECVQGRSVALVSTLASQRALKDEIRAQQSVTLIADPENAALGSPAVLVATMADIPTLMWYIWDAVLLCDAPVGVECDGVFKNAHRKIAVATELEWMSWRQALDLHDDLEEVLQRVNG